MSDQSHPCPSCDRILDTDFGLKQHHVKTHGESLAFKECQNCGEKFKPVRLDRKFCSDDCYRDDHDFTGENNPRWSETIEKPCDSCGNVIELDPWQLKDYDSHFCSSSCKYDDMRGLGQDVYTVLRGVLTEQTWNTYRQRNVGDKCRMCERTERLHLHHIVPVMAGGPSCNANLITLCATHHRKSETLTGDVFERVLENEVKMHE